MSHHDRKLPKVFTIIGGPSPCHFSVVLRIVDIRWRNRRAGIRRVRRLWFQCYIESFVVFRISSEAKTKEVGGGCARHNPTTFCADQLGNFS